MDVSGENQSSGENATTPPVPKTTAPTLRINTVLYLAQYLHKDQETCKEMLEGYVSISKETFKIAEKRLRDDLLSRNVEGVDSKSPHNSNAMSKTRIKSIFELLNLANLESNTSYQYYPDLSDSNIIIDGATQARKLEVIEDNIEMLSEACDRLKKKLAEVSAVTASNLAKSKKPSNNQTAPNSFAPINHLTVPQNPTYATITSARSRGNSISSSSKRHAPDVSGTSNTRPRIRNKSPMRVIPKNTGSGGPIKSGGWNFCGPRKKVACKLTVDSSFTLVELKTYCENSSKFEKVRDKLSFAELSTTKAGRNCRVVCSSWPSDPMNLFTNPEIWPTGSVVVPWKGLIRPIVPRKAIRKFLGNFNSKQSTEGIKEEILRLYKEKKVDNIVVTVEDFVGKSRDQNNDKPKAEVANFVVEITTKDGKSAPDDILEDIIDDSIYVRHWSGPLPSKALQKTTTQGTNQRKLFGAAKS